MKYIHPLATFEKICSHCGRLGILLHYSRKYRTLRHEKINVCHPSNISEFNIKEILSKDFNIMAAKYADKYSVRNYIVEKGLGETLLDCYGVWETPEEIDWDSLPNQFALKANNGCGGHVFCYDKNAIDKQAAIKKVRLAMSIDEVDFAFEPHYKLIPPRVYAEELMLYKSQADIVDYKFFCVKGEIDSVLVVFDRQENGEHNMELYDTNWNSIEGLTKEFTHTPIFPRPHNFKRMCEIAAILSADFDFVRVDLYEYNNKVYFGELTFTPQGAQFAHFTDQYIKRLYQHMLSVR